MKHLVSIPLVACLLVAGIGFAHESQLLPSSDRARADTQTLTASMRGRLVHGAPESVQRLDLYVARQGVPQIAPAAETVGDDVIGGAIGHQAFFDHKSGNVIFELACRKDLSANGFGS